ncbi:MAG: YjfB family protein [Lachnospiraceae bacterium]|nr:YjfB family protein [Lachnospiraceae bacterium]
MSVGGIGPTIVNTAMTLAKSRNMDQVGTKVLSNALDAQEAAGAGLLKMIDAAAMERSVTPYIGGNFDASV